MEHVIPDFPSEKIPRSATVLVIDDDDNWCFLSRRMLSKVGVSGPVITANNGLAALNILRTAVAGGNKLPELIFLDLNMPVMDGFEFLNEVTLAADLDFSCTRIFICSSSFHPKDRERAGLYPIAGFITKPFTKDILNGILRGT